jgi:hypothetical protein
MSFGMVEQPVAKERPKYSVTKIDADVLRDARIVCSITGEDLQDYLTRLLKPLVARDKDGAFDRERTASEGPKPKKKPDRS